MTNGIRNVRLGVDIFDKRILSSCKFISDTALQNITSSTAIFSLQPAEYKPVLQYMVHNLSIFYFLCFHFPCFWQEGGGRERERERERETPPSLLYHFLFFQVGCNAMLFHTGFCSATRNWRKLCIRTVISPHLTISEKKRLTYINLHRQMNVMKKSFLVFFSSQH